MEEAVPLLTSGFPTSLQSVTFETAIHYSGYGRFQNILLMICGFIYATCAISTTTLSFVLPAAECDFQLTSSQKGELTAIPLIGMIIGSFLWGALADSRGRKSTLMIALIIDFLGAILSAFAQSYTFLLICRFFCGFGIIGAVSIVFSYMGEFLSDKHRDSLLSRLEVFWDIGCICLAGLAWITLANYKFEKTDSVTTPFTFNAWKLFLLVCSIPSLISSILLCFLPETPKYLITNTKFTYAKEVFKFVYKINTGKSAETYPELVFREEENYVEKIVEEPRLPFVVSVINKVKSIGPKLRDICCSVYFKYILLVCFIDLGLMSSYYTLIMWFPELFDRIKIYEEMFPNKTATICGVTEAVATFEQNKQICISTIDRDVFIYTLLIDLSCLPTSFLLSYAIRKIGKKNLLVVILILPGFATIGFNWVSSVFETLAFASIFQTFASVAESVLFCVVVDLFPTNLRGFALSLTATFGRLGAVLSNFVFGLYVDTNCQIPIYSFGFLLLTSGLFSLLIPESRSLIV